jgi:hypothetical protein
LSPFSLRKEEEQVKTLQILWRKLGSAMKGYNDLLSKWTTSTSLDKDTWKLYS